MSLSISLAANFAKHESILLDWISLAFNIAFNVVSIAFADPAMKVGIEVDYSILSACFSSIDIHFIFSYMYPHIPCRPIHRKIRLFLSWECDNRLHPLIWVFMAPI